MSHLVLIPDIYWNERERDARACVRARTCKSVRKYTEKDTLLTQVKGGEKICIILYKTVFLKTLHFPTPRWKAPIFEKSVLVINKIQFLWKMPPSMTLSAFFCFSTHTHQTEKFLAGMWEIMQQFLIFSVTAGENDSRDLHWSYLSTVNYRYKNKQSLLSGKKT